MIDNSSSVSHLHHDGSGSAVRTRVKRCLQVTDSNGSTHYYSGIKSLFAHRMNELDCPSSALYAMLRYCHDAVTIGSLTIKRANVDANKVNVIGNK